MGKINKDVLSYEDLSRMYPWNLYSEIIQAKSSNELADLNYVKLLEVIDGCLTDRERSTINFRFNDGLTYEECGKQIGVGRDRARQIEQKAIRKLRNHVRSRYFRTISLSEYEDLKYQLHVSSNMIERVSSLLPKNVSSDINRQLDLQDKRIDDLELSVRSYNCLKRAGIYDLYQLSRWKASELMKIRNFGVVCLREILEKAESFGVVIENDIEEANNEAN